MIREGPTLHDLTPEQRAKGDAKLLRDIAEVVCPSCGRDDGEPGECERCGRVTCDICTWMHNGLHVCPDCKTILRYQSRGRRGNVIDLAHYRRRRGKACSA